MVKTKYTTIDELLEVLFENGKISGFSVGGQKLPDGDVRQLRADAEAIAGTMLWKLMQKRTIFAAQVQACDNAKDFGDTREARGIIRAVALFNEIIEVLRKVETK